MKTKFNLSAIMKRAWSAVKNKGMQIASAMRWSWKLAKEGTQQAAEFVSVMFSRETEKAVAISVTLVHSASDLVVKKTLLWIPKSLVKGNNVPTWFLRKKEQELIDDCGYNHLGRISLEYNF